MQSTHTGTCVGSDALAWGLQAFFWCRLCRNWFQFDARARRHATWASIAAIAAPLLLLRVMMASAEVQDIAGWPAALALIAILFALYNAASCWVLAARAKLEGPVDHAP